MLAGKPTKLTCVSVLRMPMETSYKNSVSFKTRKPESIQCFSTQDTTGQNSVSLRQRNLNQFNVSVLMQDINGQNSVSLRQGNLKQFNVSVLRILTENTVYH